MSGFVVTFHPVSDANSADNSSILERIKLEIDISDTGVKRIATDRNHIAMIDGYAIGISSQRLVAALESHDDDFLSQLHGSYCVLIIQPNGTMQGFCDRFGANSLYWQTTQQHGIIISSRWRSMPVFERQWDDLGLAETLRYRWTTGQKTLIAGISKLPLWNRVSFSHDGDISVSETAQRPHWPDKFDSVSFDEKVDETRAALTGALNAVAQSYDKAAIFLSGGVDSSLLAALSKSCFKKCLLVTPVFSNESNPELDTAKSFAETLQLEHLLVDFDPTRLEKDLQELTRAKDGQIHFHSLAIHQMIDAIPDEYQLLIHGQEADTFFGSSPVLRTEKYLRWKRNADRLPTFGWKWLSRLPIQRIKTMCRLLQTPTVDITLQQFQIQYDSESMAVIRGLCKSELDDLYAHQAVIRSWSERDVAMRGLLQDVNLMSIAVNQIRDLNISANNFGKHIFMPFTAEPVVSAAKTLTRDQYFGNEYVKPVLRELACEFFDRELIYREKHGFDVPVVSWLNGPLAHLVDAARQERNLFDGRLLSDFDVQNHYSLFWTLISWQLIDDHINV